MSDSKDLALRRATSLATSRKLATAICQSEGRSNSVGNRAPLLETREILPLGTLVGSRYSIRQALGQGGWSRTYLATDIHRFGEPCVLKEFCPSRSGKFYLSKARDLFEREAQMLSTIHHPQIPKFLGFFQDEGRLFLVQEFVNGKTYSALLQERLQRGEAFTEFEIVQWLLHLLPVLTYIHNLGIFHRDISPDNIMLPQGQSLPVLIDFGVAKQVFLSSPDDADELDRGERECCVGKMGYSPWEQISMGRCSANSDLYSLGVVAAVLLTGKEPKVLIGDESMEWEWRAHVNTSEGFACILDKMLAQHPRHRYQSATDVLTALQSLVANPYPPSSNVIALRPTVPSVAIAAPRRRSLPRRSLPEERSSTDSRKACALSVAFAEQCYRELAEAIGQQAEPLLEEALSPPFPTSQRELVERLAVSIPDLTQAEAFRQRFRKAASLARL
jgi:serine/threonine-protein kinase